MIKDKLFLLSLIILSGYCFIPGAFAYDSPIKKQVESSIVNIQTNDPTKLFNNDHWAYKTLENISRKYGLLIGQPGEKFDGSKSLTRGEAAVILINLNGKIEQDNLMLSEAEKAQLDILKQELSGEIQSLAGRVTTLESSVDTLKGSVSRLEKSDQSAIKTDFGEKFKLTGAIQARYSGVIKKGTDNYPANFRLPTVEVGVSGKLHKHLNYRASLLPSRNFDGSTKTMMGDVYVVTDILPHHNIYLGQTRIPIGQEGTTSPLSLETIDRAQIARAFSDVRDLGIKVVGNWSYIDYYAGVYNGTRNNKPENNTGLDLANWIVLKPLAKKPQFGSLELGGGYASGKNTYKYDTLGAYAGYKYKKYAIKAEYGLMDGYLALNRKADGWYIHNSYDLTDKIQLVARYDTFDPNTKVKSDVSKEYTIGGNYFFHKQNIKLMLNLVYVDNQAGKGSNRVVMQTQYKF